MGSISSLAGLTREDLKNFAVERGMPAYRADQIWNWLYKRMVFSWDGMTNLPAALRNELAGELDVVPVERSGISREESGTTKIVVRLKDGRMIEEVLIPSRTRRTVCISSQVGCSRRCVFCASGKKGLLRNLEAGEMVGQVLIAASELGERPGNVVYMGIGEPFDNYDEVLKSVRIINDGDGLGIGARKITISTCGIVPGIQRLASEGLQVELSVSLHAADEKLRNRLLPVNREYPLSMLIPECRKYVEATGRMITFEYTLIDGVNDTLDCANSLVELIKGFNSRVNLIPLSQVDGAKWRSTPGDRAERFQEVLMENGVNCTLRLSKGAALKAACGQLSPEFGEDRGRG